MGTALIEESINVTCTNDLTCNLFNSSHCTVCKDPSYYAIPYRIIGTVFQGFILIVGKSESSLHFYMFICIYLFIKFCLILILIWLMFKGVLGNIMVVIVVVRARSMKTPTNCYLVSLSIADMITLMAAVPNEIIAYYVLGDQWIWGKIGCNLLIFLQYLGINASALSITAFTIERYIGICHPMKAQKMCTVHRAKRIIIIVWCFAFVYCCPWIFLTKTEPLCYRSFEQTNIETCTFALSRKYYWTYYFTDLVIFYVFPLFLSCVLYGFIARILFIDTIPKESKKSNSSSKANPQSGNMKKSSQANDNSRAQVNNYLYLTTFYLQLSI